MLNSVRLGGASRASRLHIQEECSRHFEGQSINDKLASPHGSFEAADKHGSRSKLEAEGSWQTCNQTNALSIRVSFPHRLHSASSCGDQFSGSGPADQGACSATIGNDFGTAAVKDWSSGSPEVWEALGRKHDPCFSVLRLSGHAVRVQVGPEHAQVFFRWQSSDWWKASLQALLVTHV